MMTVELGRTMTIEVTGRSPITSQSLPEDRRLPQSDNHPCPLQCTYNRHPCPLVLHCTYTVHPVLQYIKITPGLKMQYNYWNLLKPLLFLNYTQQYLVVTIQFTWCLMFSGKNSLKGIALNAETVRSSGRYVMGGQNYSQLWGRAAEWVIVMANCGEKLLGR